MYEAPAHTDTRIDVDMRDLMISTADLSCKELGQLFTETLERIHRGDCENIPRWVDGYRHIKGDLRSERMRKAEGWASRADKDARIALYGGLCWICGAEYQAIDHVKPIAKGGSNWPANLRPICQPCNSRKGAKWPFRPERTL